MRIIKITEKSTTPDEEGLWRVYGMVQIGNSFQYGVLLYETEEEAKKAEKGSFVDVERVMFSRRTNNIISNEFGRIRSRE